MGTVRFNEDNVLLRRPSGNAENSGHPGGKDAEVSEAIRVEKMLDRRSVKSSQIFCAFSPGR